MELTTAVIERVCVRGCVLRDGHGSGCVGVEQPDGSFSCRGCAPAPARAGVLVCDRCYRRADRLLSDAPDLLGRLRSLSDPTRAMVIEQVKTSSQLSETIAPVSPDLLDAATEIMRNLRDWADHLDGRPMPREREAGMPAEVAYDRARMDVVAIRAHLERALNDTTQIAAFCSAVLDHHGEDEHGARHWSIADAAARWGVERRDRDKHRHVFPAETITEEESAQPVREWHNPLITLAQAAERHDVAERTIRKWMKAEVLTARARVRGAGGTVVTYFFAADVDAAAEAMAERRTPEQLVARFGACRPSPEGRA